MPDTLLKLTNSDFDFEWDGEVYKIKKANLAKVALYQERANSYYQEKTPGGDAKLAAYGIYLALRDVKPDITENDVLEKTPGGIDTMELAITLGFLKPAKEAPIQSQPQ
jgi:hypothetical protein